MPKQGVASSFTFGRTLGVAETAAAALGAPVLYLPPATWKKAMGLTSDKEASRALATSLFPLDAAQWSRKKDDGRAEAALLAHYLSLLHKHNQL